MKPLKKFYTNKDSYQGTNVLQFEVWRLSFHWFTDCGDWFIYLRWNIPSFHCVEVKEIRFSSAGFMTSEYILR